MEGGSGVCVCVCVYVYRRYFNYCWTSATVKTAALSVLTLFLLVLQLVQQGEL